MAKINPTAARLEPRQDGSKLRRAGILGTGSDIPDRVLSNHDLESIVDTSDEWIHSRTGMRERRIAAPGQGASDLAVRAGRRALESAKLPVDKLELIIVATFTPDRPLPATACYVQQKLGAKNAAGFDLSIACTGFINALMTADSLVAGGLFRNALVIGTEVMSSVVDYEDRDSCVLFGDAAGATVVGIESSSSEILDHVVKIDGAGTEMIAIPSGGSAAPMNADRLAARENFLRLSGRQVFKFAVNAIGDVVGEILTRNGFTIADVDLFIPHQANLRIIEAAATRLEIDMDRVFVNIERFGNTSAASVPLALDEAVAAGRVKRGDLVCLVAFGAGLSWGATLIRW